MEILKKELLRSGALSQEEMARAEDYALTRGMPLDEALVFLNMVDYELLGNTLSRLLGAPYRPLLPQPPDPPETIGLIPLKIARRFEVFPLRHDPGGNELLLAASAPGEREKDQELIRLLPSGLRLSLAVASGAEIRKAIEVHYLGKPYTPPRELELPDNFTIMDPAEAENIRLDIPTRPRRNILLVEPDPARAKALKTLLAKEGVRVAASASDPEEALRSVQEETPDLVVFNRRALSGAFSETQAHCNRSGIPTSAYDALAPLLLGEAYPYQEVGEALLRVVSLVMSRSLAKTPEKLKETRRRARYVRLLALRMGLPPARVDAVVLASWLSAGPLGRELAKELERPYGVPALLRPRQGEGGRGDDETASSILSLVAAFQGIERRDPAAAADARRVRSILGQVTGLGAGDPVLEGFIHLLRDENFLGRLGGPMPRVLLVDPAAERDSGLVLRLENEGYDVRVVRGAREAAGLIREDGAHLILSETALPGTDGVAFCRALKQNSKSKEIPFIFLSAPGPVGLQARCLEAGADDFLEKPVDLDVLCLKIRRLLSERPAPEEGGGVRGRLTEMSFTDIIQSLTSGEKDVVIDLKNGDRRAQVFIRAGEVIHAKTDRKAGEEAFYQVMSWEDGTFRIVPRVSGKDRSRLGHVPPDGGGQAGRRTPKPGRGRGLTGGGTEKGDPRDEEAGTQAGNGSKEGRDPPGRRIDPVGGFLPVRDLPEWTRARTDH
ncbi:MAG: response regulator [Deltaproteobacteria bacterium]|nr:response regulator [Deltaproteobacteria bacterium]